MNPPDPLSDSRSLLLLTPVFQDAVQSLLKACARRNVIMVPYFTRRTPQTQARLYCQSRTSEEIRTTSRVLSGYGAPVLSSLLSSCPVSTGKWSTDALPGASWHQWGEAVDCFVQSGGKAIWDPAHPGYAVYAQEAIKLNLTPGILFRHKDADHVQLRSDGSPIDQLYNWSQIEQQMLLLYPDLKPSSVSSSSSS